MSTLADGLAWPTAVPTTTGDPYAAYAAAYHQLFGDQVEDVPFYLHCAAEHGRPGQPLIELGVGTGRLAAHLLQSGHAVIGVDSSAAMLAEAERNLAGADFRAVQSDLTTMRLGCRAPLIVGAYGMVAHLLTDADRVAAFQAIREHLEPGGWFIYDDRPGWMMAEPETGRFEVEREITDPTTGLLLRLSVSRLPLADQPLSVSDEVLDWLRDGALVRREVVRLHFRDVPLEQELALLTAAGFQQLELLGGFDGRPFDRARPAANERLIIRCRRTSP